MPISPSDTPDVWKYRIQVISDYCSARPKVEFDTNIVALPRVIEYLDTLGVDLDLSATFEVLHRIEERHEKAKKAEEDSKLIIETANAVRADSKGERRFVASWLDEDDKQRGVITKKGTEFADGHIQLDRGVILLDRYESIDALRKAILRVYPTTPTIAIVYLDQQR